MPTPPPIESGFVQSGDNGNTRFYRTGCQFQEWGESRLPAMPATFHSPLPDFGSAALHMPQWDGTARHDRVVSSIEAGSWILTKTCSSRMQEPPTRACEREGQIHALVLLFAGEAEERDRHAAPRRAAASIW